MRDTRKVSYTWSQEAPDQTSYSNIYLDMRPILGEISRKDGN